MEQYRNINAGGWNIFYREAGPADAPTVLLLHGYPTSSHMFRKLIPILSGRYHVIAPDLPGFGYSQLTDKAPYAYTFDHLAATMQSFIDALGLKRFAIYVFDYGAPVGFRLAVANPEKITGIISQNGNAYEEGLSTGFDPLRKYWQDPSQENRDALKEFATGPFTKWQYTEGVKDPSLIAPETYTLDQHFLNQPGNLELQLDLMKDYQNNVRLYPKFHAYFRQYQPGLLAVWGDSDPFFLPAGAEAYKKDIPNAVVKLYPTGHFALETHLEEIGQEILQFLAGLANPSASAASANGPAYVAPASEKRFPLPPFTLETARQKVQLAEDAWNTKDPDKVSLAYTIDTEWRNRTEFINGREEVKAFLKRKWEKELDYKLKKELWGFRDNRMAVRFEYTWHDAAGQWYRSYGNELWEFDENGLMRKRYASINDKETTPQ